MAPTQPRPPVLGSKDGIPLWKIPTLRLRIDDLAHRGVPIFFEAVPDPTELLRRAVTNSLKWLYTPETAPDVVENILLILTPFIVGIASTAGTRTHKEVSLSLAHIANTGLDSAAHEIEGVLTHEIVRSFQNNAGGTAPGGLIAGIADYVRLRASLAPPHWPRPSDSTLAIKRWDSGFDTTAYFLLWIDETFDAVRAINAAMAQAPFDVVRVFEGVTGVGVKELWTAYVDAVESGWGKEDELGSDVGEGDGGWPILRFDVRIDDVAHAGADIFLAAVRPKEVLHDAVRASFERLYTPRTAPRNVKVITLILRAMPGVAHTCGSRSHKEIHFSLDYIAGIPSNRATEEITGVLFHEVVHCFQHNARGTAPGGLVEGIADYIRLHEGLAPPHWKRDVHPDERWDQGYSTTAYFLAWLDTREGGGVAQPTLLDSKEVKASVTSTSAPTPQATGIPISTTMAKTNTVSQSRVGSHDRTDLPLTARLNERLHNSRGMYNSRVFVELAGAPVETLWSEYCAALALEKMHSK